MKSDIADMNRMIALNVEALTGLTYASVPGFVNRSSGTIINIASIVAVAPERLNGVYSGTKAFVLAFSQSLRQKLADTGVKVQVVLPGAPATDFWRKSGGPIERLPQQIAMSAGDMVDAALAALDQASFVTIPALRTPDNGKHMRMHARQWFRICPAQNQRPGIQWFAQLEHEMFRIERDSDGSQISGCSAAFSRMASRAFETQWMAKYSI